MSADEDDAKDRARAAKAAAELKETEDLLAGFDRPGRTPRAPAVRDFVDFHSRKGSDPNIGNSANAANANASAAAANTRANATDDKRALSTFVLPKESRQFPSWLTWAIAMLAMAGGGAAFAWCMVNSGDHDGAASSMPSTSAATTISAGSAPTTTRVVADRDTPPAPPPVTGAVIQRDTTPTTSSETPPQWVALPTPASPHTSSSVARPPPPSPTTSPPPPPASVTTPTGPSANPEFIRTL